MLLLIFTISRVHQHFDFLAAGRPSLVLAAAAVFFGFMNGRILELGHLFRYWPTRVMAALGLLAAASVPFALSFGASASYLLFQYSKVLVFAFLLVLAIRDTRDLSFLVWGYVAAVGILGFMAVFLFELQTSGPGESVQRLSNLYTFDANDIGCVMMVGLPLTLLTYQTSRTWGKILSVLVLILIGVTVARSGSRGMFVGLGAVVLAILLWMRHVDLVKRLAVVALLAVTVIVAAPQGYWSQMSTLMEPEEDYNWTSPTGRKALTLRGIDYMLENPVFGLGLHNFQRAEGTISERARNFTPGDPGVKWSAPHNSYIQAGAELGIPGLILWSSLVFGCLVGVRRLKKRLPERWRHGDAEERFLFHAALYLPVSIFGFAITAAFVSFAWIDVIYVLGAFVCGLYLAVEKKHRREAGPSGGRTRSRSPRAPGPGQSRRSREAPLAAGPAGAGGEAPHTNGRQRTRSS